jgi:outer membrane protein assembly factor BamD
MPRDPARTVRLELAAVVVLSAMAGCRSRGDDKPVQGTPESIHAEARKDLRNFNFDNAIVRLEALEARYPFSEEAKQGQLDLLYAYYRNREPESAIDQADQFIRENPTHPRVDYANYIKGLVYFEGGANFLERFFRVDIAKRPPQEARQSFQAFQTLVQQYPRSPYAADARQRMIFLRNKLADYEIRVAQYYMKRGAYVGAANRARGVVETYDGAPATLEAMSIMAEAYRRLEIDDMATAIDGIAARNVSPDDPQGKSEDKPWWRFGF